MITQVVKMHQRTLKEHCGPCPHELIREFLKTHFFIRVLCLRGLNNSSGKQFPKQCDFGVRIRCWFNSCEQKAVSCKKVCGFKNIWISVY